MRKGWRYYRQIITNSNNKNHSNLYLQRRDGNRKKKRRGRDFVNLDDFTLTFPASLMAAMILTWSENCARPTVEMTTSTCLIAFTKLSWSCRSPCNITEPINKLFQSCNSSIRSKNAKIGVCFHFAETKTNQNINIQNFLFFSFPAEHYFFFLSGWVKSLSFLFLRSLNI